MDSKYEAWRCQRCGAEIGYLGRAMEWLVKWTNLSFHGCRRRTSQKRRLIR